MINAQAIGKLTAQGLLITGCAVAAVVVAREFVSTKSFEDACTDASNNMESNNPIEKVEGVIQTVALCTAPVAVAVGTSGLLMGGTQSYCKAFGEVGRTVAKIVK